MKSSSKEVFHHLPRSSTLSMHIARRLVECEMFETFRSSILLKSSKIAICLVQKSTPEPIHLPRGKEILIFLPKVQVACTGQGMRIKLGKLLLHLTITIQLSSHEQSNMELIRCR
ncbi:hypothetical protein L3X38_023109 [Prunus dulcis]|uniref:Uncharacterized protein n=1 Tax=Prunus dulcis TaxID=3755 RepID=A0AAD4Z4Y3_PRUDU|nr:hypothetical protein L3X38_023109 [Prunus dulcis]